MRGKPNSKLLKRAHLTQKYFNPQNPNELLIRSSNAFSVQSATSFPIPENVETFKALHAKMLSGQPLDEDTGNFVDFIDQCLALDPMKRLSASEALKHPFLMMLVNRIKNAKIK